LSKLLQDFPGSPAFAAVPAADALEQLAKALAPLVTDQLRRSPTAIERRLLTVVDAAEYLGRSEEAVRHLLRTRKIHAVRADGRVLIDKRDLDFWIDVNKR
jgi:excisionase family DNA binding protein